jgi:hypothetical protein
VRDRDVAKRLRDEAEIQLRLLTEVDFRTNSDFYVYRYFAGEGFLPGYSFPRLPLGNHLSGRTLCDAVRLGFRSAAGPFRSLAHLGVEPRPYQLVPLLMALRLDPVRILIADDVGIGKTIEACLIARELLDRGEIQRLSVLCPPHLAEQWVRALRDQFHLDAVLVLGSTAPRLERDYIKQDRHPSPAPRDRNAA